MLLHVQQLDCYSCAVSEHLAGQGGSLRMKTPFGVIFCTRLCMHQSPRGRHRTACENKDELLVVSARRSSAAVQVLWPVISAKLHMLQGFRLCMQSGSCRSLGTAHVPSEDCYAMGHHRTFILNFKPAFTNVWTRSN